MTSNIEKALIGLLIGATLFFGFAWLTDLLDSEPNDLTFVSNTMHTPFERVPGDTVEYTNLWCNNTNAPLKSTFSADIIGIVDDVLRTASSTAGEFTFEVGCVPVTYNVDVTEEMIGGVWHQTGVILNGRDVTFSTLEFNVGE